MRPRILWRKVRDSRFCNSDASVTALTNCAIAVMGFGTGIISARMLGPDGRGELAAIQTTPSVIASVAMMGIPEALVYLTAQRPRLAGQYLGTAIMLALMSTAPFMTIAYFAMPLLIHSQKTMVIQCARGYLLIAPLYATSGMLYHPLRGTGAFRPWNSLRLGVPILAMCVLAISYITENITPAFISYGNLATYAVLIVPAAWVVWRQIRGPFTPNPAEVAPMLRYGFPCVMTGLPQMLNLRLDQMLMAAFLPSRDLGLYVVAVAWSGAVSPLLTSIGAILLPAVASAESTEIAAARMSRGIRITTMLALVTCTSVGVAAPIAIPHLFGNNFRDSIIVALILIPAAGVLGINFSLQEGIRGLGWPYLVLRAEVLGLAVTALFLALMLRPLGITGAAIASLAGYSMVMGALLVDARSVTGTPIVSLLVPRTSELRQGILLITTFARGSVE